MRKLKLYIACSLNGKIARQDGSVDWLDTLAHPQGSDYGYQAFYDSIDTTIQGFRTYEQVLSFGVDFPYQNKENYVFTRKKDLPSADFVHFVSENHVNFVQDLKQQTGKKDIWLIGGGQINTLCWNAGLIDEIHLFIMPIMLAGGIELFEHQPLENQLSLLSQTTYNNGVLGLIYTKTS